MAIKRYDITTKLGLLLEPFSSGQLDVQEAWLELDGGYRDPNGFFIDHPEATGYIRYTLGGQQFEYSNLSFYDPYSEQSGPGHLKLDENGDLLLIRDDHTPVSGVYLCRDSNVKVYAIAVLPPASVFPNKIAAQFWHSDQETPDVQSFPPVEDSPMVLGSEVGSGGGGGSPTVTRYDMTAQLRSLFGQQPGDSMYWVEAWIELSAPTGQNGYFQLSDYVGSYFKYERNGQLYTVLSPSMNDNGVTNLRLDSNGDLLIDNQDSDPNNGFRDSPSFPLPGSQFNEWLLSITTDDTSFIYAFSNPVGSTEPNDLSNTILAPYTTSWPYVIGTKPSGGGGGGGGGSGVSLPSSTTVVGGKVVASVSVNPTLIEVTLGGQPLPVGSILRNSSEGGKKYLKIVGGATAFKSISVQPDVSWNWDADGAAAWAVLQNK